MILRQQNTNSNSQERFLPGVLRQQRPAPAEAGLSGEGSVLSAASWPSGLPKSAPPPGVRVTHSSVNLELPAPACPAGPSDRGRRFSAHGRWGFFRLFT